METSPVNWSPLNLQDDLVKLVPLVAEDFEVLYQVASDPAIWQQHPFKDRYKKEVFQLFFDGAVSSQTAFLIKTKATDQLIGTTRFYDYKPSGRSIAIGYTFLSVTTWGGQYNSAIKKLMMDYAFRFVDQIYFHVGVHNIRSQKAVEKLGAKMVREMNFDHNGTAVPHYEYVLSR